MLVVLALREGARRETFRLLLESERSDCSVKLCGDGRTALLDTQALAPQVLALDQVLPLLDGPAVLVALQEACLPCPPKVILLNAPGQEMICPVPPGVDEALSAHADFSEFLCALQRAEEKLQGALAILSAPRRRTLIEALFMELGMPKSLKGRAYLSFILDHTVPSPALLDALTTRLYPAVAERFSTSPAAVERCIRHAIESTWSRGDMAALEKLFGLSIDPDRGKPTNREFLAMVSQHLRQRAAPQKESQDQPSVII